MTWSLFIRAKGVLRRSYSLVFVAPDESFSATINVQSSNGSYRFDGQSDGFDFSLYLKATSEAFEGNLSLAGQVRGEMLVRNGYGQHPDAELALPGLRQPLCLVRDTPTLVVSPLRLLSLGDAVVEFFPSALRTKAPASTKHPPARSHRYFGEVTLKKGHRSLSELSRGCITAFAVVVDEIVEPSYMRVDAA